MQIVGEICTIRRKFRATFFLLISMQLRLPKYCHALPSSRQSSFCPARLCQIPRSPDSFSSTCSWLQIWICERFIQYCTLPHTKQSTLQLLFHTQLQRSLLVSSTYILYYVTCRFSSMCGCCKHAFVSIWFFTMPYPRQLAFRLRAAGCNMCICMCFI